MTTQVDVNTLSPEQIANMDMDQLSALVDANEPEMEAENVVTDESTNPAEGDDKPEGTQSEAKTEPANDDKPEGVATRDGKKVIPYEVLEKTRNENKDLRTQAEQLAQQKAEAEAKLKELSEKLASQDDGNVADADLFTEEELEAMAEDLPDTASRLRAMQDKFKKVALSAQHQEKVIAEQQQQTIKSTVQQAIDDVPKLALIQANNPRLFGLAQQIDAELREKAKTDPQLASKSMKERFELVVQELEKELGQEIKLPSNKNTIEIKQQRINGLDDMPGGQSPVADELEAKLQRSPIELANEMHNMTEAQLSEFIDRASRYIN